MDLKTFDERAKRANKIRATRDDRHYMFELDNPQCTYNTIDLSVLLNYKSTRALRTALNNIEKEGLYTFNRGDNNHFMLTANDVWWLCDHLEIPSYRSVGKRGFVLNVINLKGGVGKSTSTTMIGDGLTLDLNHITKRMKVLLIDLDPQGSTTKQTLGNFKPDDLFLSAITLMDMDKKTINRDTINQVSIHKTGNDNLDIIPCTPEDGFLAPELAASAKRRGVQVHDLLKDNVIDFIAKEYDVVVIDAGPHLDDVFLAAMGASDGGIVPVPPKELDFDSTLKFIERLPEIFRDMIKDGYNLERLQFFKSFLNMWVENPRSVAGQAYNNNAINELEIVFGEIDLLDKQLPNEPTYQRCANSQKTVFSMSASTYDNELGDRSTFIAAKKAASDWLGCIWKAIAKAHDKIEG